MPKAIALPENDTAPITSARSVGRVTPNGGVPRPAPSSRENSRIDTSAAAPPPAPLNSATICGIAVILTIRAPAKPATPPTSIPATITGTPPCTSCVKNVAMTATSIPAAAMRLPITAVVGEERPFNPRMKVTAATRYASGMSDSMFSGSAGGSRGAKPSSAVV